MQVWITYAIFTLDAKHGARLQFSLCANVITTFLQVVTPEIGHSARSGPCTWAVNDTCVFGVPSV